MVHVVDDEWAARSRTGVVVRERQPRSGVDLRLERGSVIRGRVTAGQPPQPAAGVAVMLSEQGPAVPKGTFPEQPTPLIEASLRIVDTDADGRYAFRVGPGRLRAHRAWSARARNEARAAQGRRRRGHPEGFPRLPASIVRGGKDSAGSYA